MGSDEVREVMDIRQGWGVVNWRAEVLSKSRVNTVRPF